MRFDSYWIWEVHTNQSITKYILFYIKIFNIYWKVAPGSLDKLRIYNGVDMITEPDTG